MLNAALKVGGQAFKLVNSHYGVAALSAVNAAGEAKSGNLLGAGIAVAEAAISIAFPPVGVALFAGELLYAGVSIGNQVYRKNTQHIRAMRTPFSHSFSHTDATYSAQQRGLSMIGRHSGLLGSEAGMMSQMYARR